MKITRNTAERVTAQGPADWFTGTVFIDTVRNPDEQSKVGAAAVHFTPGARTAWHTHPFGQTLYVVEGLGRVQRAGGRVEEIRPGDSIYIEPGESHWHGSAPGRFMMHIAMQEADESGSPVTWGEHVTDEEYAAQPVN
jgi:quercetin dioxygenase-like cupin family protein